MKQNLTTLSKGEERRLIDILDKNLKNRLMEMGLRLGAPVKIVRKAPLGGACIIQSKSLSIAIRTQQLDKIIVEN